MFSFKNKYNTETAQSSLPGLKGLLHNKVLEELDDNFTELADFDISNMVKKVAADLDFFDGVDLSDGQTSYVINAVIDDLLGFGPIAPYMLDDEVSDILINDFDDIWVDKQGRLVKTASQFDNPKHLLRFVERTLNQCGKQTNTLAPIVDGKMVDGSRLSVIIPPACTSTAVVSIRKFSHKKVTRDYLISSGLISSPWLKFLECAVKAGVNIVISGNAGAGKTSFLNILASSIDNNERIVTIEESTELKLHHRHIVQLEAHSSNSEGKGNLDLSDLVKASLRMRADRIIVGEVRAAEVLDMLQAMSCGHQGSMTTLHANSAQDTITRLCTLTQMHNQQFTSQNVNSLIHSCVQLVVNLVRTPSGKRVLKSIGEVVMEDGQLSLSPLFCSESNNDEISNEVLNNSPLIQFMRSRGISEAELSQLLKEYCYAN